MDHYPKVNASERECASSRPSTSSSPKKHHRKRSLVTKAQDEHIAPPQYTSFPSPSNVSEEQKHSRNGSIQTIHNDDDAKVHHIETECAQYMDAPPPYSEKAYEGKSEDEQTRMRMADYAKELKRIMGKQLVRGLKISDHKSEL